MAEVSEAEVYWRIQAMRTHDYVARPESPKLDDPGCCPSCGDKVPPLALPAPPGAVLRMRRRCPACEEAGRRITEEANAYLRALLEE